MQSQNDMNKLSGLCIVPSVSEIYCNSTFRKLLSCETDGNKMTLFMNRWDLIHILYLLMGLWVSVAVAFSRVAKYFKLAVSEFLLSLVWNSHCGAGSIMRSSFTRMLFLIIFAHIVTLGISYKFFKIIATYNENSVKYYCIFSVLCKVFYYYFSIIYLELLSDDLGHRHDIRRLTRVVFSHE